MSLPVQRGLAHDVIDETPRKLVIPAKLQALADSLGFDVKEVSRQIPEDTLRRLVGVSSNTLEHVNEDGTVKIERNIIAGHDTLISTHSADRAHAGIAPGKDGIGSNAEGTSVSESTSTGRNSRGRFTKGSKS